MKKQFRKIGAVVLSIALALVFLFPSVSLAKQKASTLSLNSDSISIDGYYDEWEKFPETDITYKSNNKDCVHKGNIYSDGDYLYVHIKMNELYTSQMSIHSFYLKVNNKEIAIPILGVNKDGSIDWNAPIYGGMSKGIHKNLSVFLGYYTKCDNEVAFTVYDKNHTPNSEGDEIEFKISMKDITKYFHIDADSINTIAVRNPNIGGESLIFAGTPTAPIASAAVGFAFVLSIVGVYEFKKKRKIER